MSRFQTDPLERLRRIAAERRARRSDIQTLIQKQREQAVKGVNEQRKSPRLSLDEIEQLSESELGQRLAAQGPEDTRGPVQRFFDLLDLPRNIIAQAIIRPFISSRRVDRAESGTFGLPKIGISDLLDEMGIQPSTSRSVVSFLGDVVLDPTTYIGGAGGKLLAVKGGQISIKRSAERQLASALTDIASKQSVIAGDRIADLAPILSRAERISKRAETLVPRLRAGTDLGEFTQQQLREQLRGKVLGRKVLAKSKESPSLLPFRQGLIARNVGRESELGEAATKFLQKESRGRGWYLGVPFTDARVRFAGKDRFVDQLKAASTTGMAARGAQTIAEAGPELERIRELKRKVLYGDSGFRSEKISGGLNPSDYYVDAAGRVQRRGDFVKVGEQLIDPTMGGEQGRLFTETDAARPMTLIQESSKNQPYIADLNEFVERSADPEVIAQMWRNDDSGLVALKAREKQLRESLAGEEVVTDMFGNPTVRRDSSAAAKVFQSKLDEVQNRIAKLQDDFAGLHEEEEALLNPMLRNEDGQILNIARTVQDLGVEPTMLGRASKAIRVVPGVGDSAANAIDGFDRRMAKLLNYGNRDNPFAVRAREAVRSITSRRVETISAMNGILGEIGQAGARLAPDNPEAASEISDIISLKLAISEAIGHGEGLVLPGVRMQIRTADDIALAREQAARLFGKDSSGNPIGWDEMLDRAESAMRDRPDIWNDEVVNAMTDRLRDRVKSVAELARKTDQTDEFFEGFFPRLTDMDARVRIAQQLGQQGIRKSGEADSLFERTTNRYVWKDPMTGNVNEVYGFEREPFLTPNMSESAAEAERARAKQINDMVENAIERGLVPKQGMVSSVYHINRMAETGRFAKLLGGDYKARLLDSDPVRRLAHFENSVYSRKIRREFDQYARTWAKGADQETIERMVAQGMLGRSDLADGKVGYRVINPFTRMLRKVETNGKIDWFADGPVIGNAGDIIRRVNVNPNNPVIKQIGPSAELFFDDRVASKIEDFARRFDDPTETHNLLRMLDGATGFYKSMTLAHPSWTVMNTLGHVISSALAGVTAKDLPLMQDVFGVYRTYNRFIRDGMIESPEAVAFMNQTMRLGNRDIRVGDFIQGATQSGVLEQGRLLRGLVRGFSKLDNESKDVFDKAMNNPVFRKWFELNHNAEQTQRLFTYAARIAHGDDMAEAASKVIQYHYDFSDMTKFEDDVMRRVFMFYPWMRNNVPAMMRLVIQEPRWAAAFPKLKESLDDAWDDDNRIPEYLRPEWLSRSYGAQIGEKTGINLPMLTQVGDIAQVMQLAFGGYQGVQGFGQYLLGQVNPLLQLPVELAQGREFFTGRPLGESDFGSKSPALFLTEQLRPVRELQRISQTVGDRELTVGEKVNRVLQRAIIGGRTTPIDTERVAGQRLFEMSKDAQALRNQINNAKRQGDIREAVRLSVRLDDLWRRMIQIDPETDYVPRQVRDRLAG